MDMDRSLADLMKRGEVTIEHAYEHVCCQKRLNDIYEIFKYLNISLCSSLITQLQRRTRTRRNNRGVVSRRGCFGAPETRIDCFND